MINQDLDRYIDRMVQRGWGYIPLRDADVLLSPTTCEGGYLITHGGRKLYYRRFPAEISQEIEAVVFGGLTVA